jgi:hypothetical protein
MTLRVEGFNAPPGRARIERAKEMGEVKVEIELENTEDRPLLGHMVLEIMDLLVNPLQQRLVPRPESPFLPELKVK